MTLSPKNMVAVGALCILLSMPVGFFYGLHELGKGEASATYEPALITRLVGYSIPILFFGGILLLLTGVILAIREKK